MNAYPGRGLHGQIVELIGARIVSGQHAPGEPLYAEALESDFQVSKTVIREALRVLAAKGLVEARQKRGTVVLPRDRWAMLDSDVLRWRNGPEPDFGFLENLAEVRGIIEPAAARLAARRRTDDDLAELSAAVEAMAGAQVGDIAAADVRFHRAVLASAHNELLNQMEVVLATGLALRDELVHVNAAGPDSLPAHRAVFHAIRDQDEDRAAATVGALLTQASEDLALVREDAERERRTS